MRFEAEIHRAQPTSALEGHKSRRHAPELTLLPSAPSSPVRPLHLRSKTASRVRKAIATAATGQQKQSGWDAAARVRLTEASNRLVASYQVPAGLRPNAAVEQAEELPPVHPMPRTPRARAEAQETFQIPQWQSPAAPKANFFQMMRRFGVYAGAILYFVLGTLRDRFHHRDSNARRAVRLRRMFERVGGTFVKMGQQMASRVDLLPLEYCEELSMMLDEFPPFPTEQAIAVLENATGRQLEEIFSAFDPKPIGSASIAVVYHAVLRETGEQVAVKIKRPGIGRLFEADFRVLDVIIGLGEAFTLIRPGVGTSIREEVRSVLTSELDFRREARIQEIYARQARQAKISFFSAPRIIPQYSNDEVIVQEYVTGMWMSDLLAGVERKDPVALAQMTEMNIDPRKVARRLLFMNYWSVFEGIAYHADPHPANIVVRPNGELVFVDFGACGFFDQPRRELYARMVESYGKDDLWEMARMAAALAEPLPAIDVNAATRDLERNHYNQVLAIKSKSAPWYERTSASSWISGLRVVAKHNLNSPGDLLMYARATLLYDTLAARLDPQINFYKEARRYFRWAKRRTQKRGKKNLGKVMHGGLADKIDFDQVKRTVDTFDGLMFRLRRLFNVPYDFTMASFTVEKWVHTLATFLRLVTQSAVIAIAAAGVVTAVQAIQGRGAQFETNLWQVTSNPLYVFVVVVLALLNLRLILFRLEHKTHSA